MEVIRTLRPGQKGTQKHRRKYGDKLVAVRYRQDKPGNRRITTVELIVDQRKIPKNVKMRSKNRYRRALQPVAVKLAHFEIDLQERIKTAGGYEDKEQGVWWIRFAQLKILKLEGREVEGLKCPDVYIYGYA